MGPNELLREFEKYNQSPSAEYLIDTRKTKIFLQPTDNVLIYDKLLLLIERDPLKGDYLGGALYIMFENHVRS